MMNKIILLALSWFSLLVICCCISNDMIQIQNRFGQMVKCNEKSGVDWDWCFSPLLPPQYLATLLYLFTTFLPSTYFISLPATHAFLQAKWWLLRQFRPA